MLILLAAYNFSLNNLVS